ncbi:LytTR family DNA-binding domain-containing protein [Puniceicoccaceae bacterium K14]|nr:LytTR family DNA-binding domain-containing protein [Puniceicoccaceae bacterium K14]
MNILIVEDEILAARRLKRLINSILDTLQLKVTHVEFLAEAQEHLTKAPTDLIFLDLDLVGEDGFELLRKSKNTRVPTIIVSANVDRALEAFDHEVVDFIAKPVEKERLARAIERAKEKTNGSERIVVKSQGQLDIVPIKEIVALSGADDYVEIATENRKRLMHYDRLDNLEKILPPNFLRIHRSHIVNISFATGTETLENGGRAIVMIDKTRYPISRRKAQVIKEAIDAL